LGLAAVTYNSAGLVSNLTFQNGAGTEQAAEQFSYDGDLRPSEDTATWQSGSGQSGQFFDETRSFDQASNLVSQTTTLAAVTGLSSTAGSETNDYCYDEQNRLVWASNSQQPSPTGSESCGSATAGTTFSAGSYSNTFTYTHLGQLWHAPVNGTGGYQQYLYCNSASPHQLTNIVPAGQSYSCSNLPVTSTYAVGYDNWGNVTSRSYNNETATLSYNKLDEMVEWQIPNTNQAWYAYDSSGERTLQRSAIGSTTTMTVYAFGLEEYNYDSSGNLQSSTHYYTLGGRLLGELQTSGSNSTTNYILTDNLGSVMAVFNSVSSSAALLSTQLYAPYGSSRFTAGTPTNYTNKGYTGQYNDFVSGLDYYNARYYAPVSGVFLSADTVQGNDSGMNPYAYAGGNPITKNDPTGHDIEPWIPPWMPWVVAPFIVNPVATGALLLIGGSILLMTAPPARNVSYPANGPQPSPAPTPTQTATPEPQPQTDTNGAMCRAGGCYDLTKDEGKKYIQPSGNVIEAHTIAQHVNITDKQLQERVLLSNSKGGENTATKFNNLTDAEWAVQYGLDHLSAAQLAQYDTLIKNAIPNTKALFQVDTGIAIGYGYQRVIMPGQPRMFNLVDGLTEVAFSVAIGQNGQPFILTAYPVLEPYVPPSPPPPSAPGHGFAP